MKGNRNPFDAIWSEIESMQNEVGELFDHIHSGKFIPRHAIDSGKCMLPVTLRQDFRVDVSEHDDEVIVVADLPGAQKDTIGIKLINPRALEISCNSMNEREDTNEENGYYRRERVYGSMSRVISLPCEVTEERSTATFKNGVLEVRLKKLFIKEVPKIEITGE